MARAYNFSAGPAILPLEVLELAREEMLDWNGSGMSVMEMSHRGKEFMSIAEQAEADLRRIMAVPDNYKVLFLQGGASSQFAMVPMNLLRGKTRADYVNTGSWSKKAIKEAQRYCDVNVAASTEAERFTRVPALDEWRLSSDAAYVHYTPNETIDGLEFLWQPQVSQVPLVADMSSTILSRPIDVSQYGLIYAGAQKNIGPAGLTLVIVREDLIGEVLPSTPSMFNYKLMADNDSMYNTPATYAWYLAGLVFKWIERQGGVEAMAKINQRKSAKLYAAIDASQFYTNPIEAASRSWMNVIFRLPSPDLDAAFLAGAKERHLLSLKGHRSVGGMRASLYNALPEEAVDALIAYMSEFEKTQG